MGAGRAEPAGPGYCDYGLRYIRKAYNALKREAAGAKAGEDPGHIHRMRVASRRLRAALPIFSSCFPRKNYRRWSRAVKTITSSLGRARDLDVQVAFLEEYLEHEKTGAGGAPRIERSGEGSDLSGLEAFLAKLKAERAAVQPEIEAIAGFFSKNGVFSDFSEAIRKAEKNRKSGADVREKAFLETGRRCAALIAFEPCVRMPDAIEAHHAMRIAAKKYRYTMEIFNEACDGRFGRDIRSIRTLQEILGRMHDCDVWIVTLQEPVVPGEVVSEHCHGTPMGDPGLSALLEDRKNQRSILYHEFVGQWVEFRERQPEGSTPDSC